MKPLGAIAAVVLATAPGAAVAEPLVALSASGTPPRIDGVIGEREWSRAFRQVGLIGEDGAPDRAVALWLARTQGRLDVAVRAAADPVRGVLARAHPRPGGDALVGLDDAIEVWLAPADPAPRVLYRIATNANGALWDARYVLSGGRWKEDTRWQSGASARGRQKAGQWEVELGIPLPGAGDTWLLRVTRVGQRPPRRSGWPAPVPDGGDPLAGMARLRLDSRAPPPEASHEPVVLSETARPWDEEVQAASLRLAFYPYAGKLRVHLDASAMPSGPALRAASVTVRAPDGREVLRSQLPVREAAADSVFDVGQLPDGKYAVAVQLEGGERAADLGTVVRTFTRRRYPWERNHLGEVEGVIPPFTPLRVEGRRVGVVLREHRMNDLGLFDQVVVEGAPLLAGPLRIEARIDGKRVRPTPTRPIELTQRGEAEVDTDAAWTAGRLRAHVTGRFEMDGMLRVELMLSGPPDVSVDRLDLVVPVRPEIASLMSAVSDRARHNRNGALRSGPGTLWTSRDLGHVEIPANFAPYVWIGDERHGLAWFAPSTRDWWVDPGTPLQQIVRGSDAVSLVVHLVTRPAPLRRDRRIVFGLQATPTKPLPTPDPRRWQIVCDSRLRVFHLCILASALEYGGATPFGDVYPRGHDESILKVLATARGSGRQQSAAVERWIQRSGVPDARKQKAFRSLEYSSRMLSSRPDIADAYLNTHGITWVEEADEFQDEWRPRSLGRPEQGALESGLRVVPTRSRQDFVLWYLDRLLASGAVDGAYFDNVFMVANYDDVVGGAYRDDSGVLRPRLDLFEVRELLKRAQILAYQRRGRWTNAIHMSTTPIAPIDTWGAVTIDGEWKYGRDDFQDRFPRDLLRAGSLGTQSGTIPAYLPGIKGARSEAERDHLERALAGATAVHGIRVWATLNRSLESLWGALYRFGYADPATNVHHYWDPDPPFRVIVAGGDAEAMVATRAGEAIAVVTSFGGAGGAELRLDAQRLGLAARGRCYDAASSGAVQTAPGGVCRFQLRRHDFRVIGFGEPRKR